MRVELVQNTPGWMKWRSEGIGASDMAIILYLSPWKLPYALWLQKTGQVVVKETKYEGDPRAHGHKLEDEARDLFIRRTGALYIPACFQSDERPYLRASLDAWDGSGGAEVKCPTSDLDHRRTRNDGIIPEHYSTQMQTQMYVTGAKRWLFVSYYEGDLAIVQIDRDDSFINNVLLPGAEAFWERVQTREWPMPEGEEDVSGDEEIVMLMRRIVDEKGAIREAENREREATALLARRLARKTTNADGFCAEWVFKRGFTEKQLRTVAPSLSLRVRRIEG
jgi:putative phage-type endonuclease